MPELWRNAMSEPFTRFYCKNLLDFTARIKCFFGFHKMEPLSVEYQPSTTRVCSCCGVWDFKGVIK